MWWNFKRFVFSILIRTSNRLFGKEIIHRSLFAGWLNRIWLDLVEIVSPTRRRQSRFERENPDAPWFVPAAIPYIEGELRPDYKGFEWGCGRSTLWFARRVGHITSVEGRRAWFEDFSRRLANDKLEARITLLLAEVTTEHDFLCSEVERYAGVINGFADGSLDFIVVDGHFRQACLRRIGNKLRSGGLLIIDNSEVVPKSLLDSLSSANTQAWNNGIWETTIIHWH
jgi:hypothetical protein